MSSVIFLKYFIGTWFAFRISESQSCFGRRKSLTTFNFVGREIH